MSRQQENFLRIFLLVTTLGCKALRRILDRYLEDHGLSLASELTIVKRKIVKDLPRSQHEKLYHRATARPVNSKDFDITALVIILANIHGAFPPPTGGWKSTCKPPPDDISKSADIMRIRYFRNDCCHKPSPEYDETTFQELWQEISDVLRRLGIPQDAIDELKTAHLNSRREVKVEDLNFSRFKGEIGKLVKEFQKDTRGWFLTYLKDFFADEEARVMALIAGPGFGKSVLSALVYEECHKHGQLGGWFFCHRTKNGRNHSDPMLIMETLASQLCEKLPEFQCELRKSLRGKFHRNSLYDAFHVLLYEPLHALDGKEPIIIVVDGLDMTNNDSKGEFLDLISDEFPKLPSWIKIFLTSRPELQVRTKLRRFSPLEILPDNKNQKEDLDRFVRSKLDHLDEEERARLAGKCQGSFLFAAQIVEELSSGKKRLNHWMSEFYTKEFERWKEDLKQLTSRIDDDILEGFVNVLAASKAPIPITTVFQCMGLSDQKLEIRNAVKNVMSRIFVVDDDHLTTHHSSLTDWLTLADGYEEHEFAANVEKGQRWLTLNEELFYYNYYY